MVNIREKGCSWGHRGVWSRSPACLICPLPREVLRSLSLEVFKSHGFVALRDVVRGVIVVG